jgi:membrane-associated protease RseP (regulator of RpoE activity)
MATPTTELNQQPQATIVKPVTMWRALRWPLLLLLISVVTTAANGARFMANFQADRPPIVSDSDLWPWTWILEDPLRLIDGLPFALALLGILLAHEGGHYLACRAHKIKSTLPHVLPAPTLSGTAGAFIIIRGRIPNRKSLLDVGIYGPLCGFVVCIPVLIAGLLLSQPAGETTSSAMVVFGEPLIIKLLHSGLLALHVHVPGFYDLVPHPILVAGWIGIFITSLNLVPAGQLDGGHILYAISPRLHAISTNICTVALLLSGILHGGWIGWLLWGCFMMLPAMHHPRVPRDTAHGPGVTLMGLLALVILVLCFIPRPFTLYASPTPRSALMDYLQK